MNDNTTGPIRATAGWDEIENSLLRHGATPCVSLRLRSLNREIVTRTLDVSPGSRGPEAARQILIQTTGSLVIAYIRKPDAHRYQVILGPGDAWELSMDAEP